MGKLLGLIAGPALPYVMIGVLVVVGGLSTAWVVRGYQLEAARGKLTACNAEKKALTDSIERQNTAVLALKAQSDAQLAKVTDAARKATVAKARADAQLAAMLAEQVPDDCDGAVSWGAVT